MNNDELQKAIDDITKDNAPVADVAPAADKDQLVNEIVDHASEPIDEKPAAPSVPEVDLGAAPAPVIPTEPAMPPMPPMPEAAEPAPAPEPVAPAPVAEAPADNNATLEEAMKELYPLLDKVEMPVEEKFDITIKYGEPARALDFAKQITDETAKANALLEIINKVK